MKVLSFKTETNGLPLWQARSNAEGQPHLVRLAAVLIDDQSDVVESMDVVIIPDDWDIPQETTDVHDVTLEFAAENGVNEKDAVELFISLVRKAEKVVSSNKTFNSRIIRIALKRYADEFHQEAWADNKDNHFCAIRMAKDDLKNKSVNLFDALAHYTGESIHNNREPLVNAQAAAKVFFAINNK